MPLRDRKIYIITTLLWIIILMSVPWKFMQINEKSEEPQMHKSVFTLNTEHYKQKCIPVNLLL